MAELHFLLHWELFPNGLIGEGGTKVCSSKTLPQVEGRFTPVFILEIVVCSYLFREELLSKSSRQIPNWGKYIDIPTLSQVMYLISFSVGLLQSRVCSV